MTKKPKPPKDTRPIPAFLLDESQDDLFGWGGTLRNLRIPKPDHTGRELIATHPATSVDYGPLGADICFFEPILLEKLCDENAGVQGALRQARKRQYDEASIAKVTAAVTSVYEDEYLPEMIRRFDQVAGLIGKYFAAKAAWKIARPEDFEEPTDAELGTQDASGRHRPTAQQQSGVSGAKSRKRASKPNAAESGVVQGASGTGPTDTTDAF